MGREGTGIEPHASFFIKQHTHEGFVDVSLEARFAGIVIFNIGTGVDSHLHSEGFAFVSDAKVSEVQCRLVIAVMVELKIGYFLFVVGSFVACKINICIAGDRPIAFCRIYVVLCKQVSVEAGQQKNNDVDAVAHASVCW